MRKFVKMKQISGPAVPRKSAQVIENKKDAETRGFQREAKSAKESEEKELASVLPRIG